MPLGECSALPRTVDTGVTRYEAFASHNVRRAVCLSVLEQCSKVPRSDLCVKWIPALSALHPSAKLRTEVESPVSVPRQFPSFVKTSTVKMSYSTTWRSKKPSLTQTGDQRLKGDFRTTTTNDRAGGLLARTGSLSGHPSKQQPRSTLLDPCSSFKLPASIDRQLFVMESVIAKVLLPEPLSISARLILSY
ncbi:hypothetical protein J6590_098470, partial [Homalodisca vitripennis]